MIKLTAKQMTWIIIIALTTGAFCGLVVKACFGAEVEIDIQKIIMIESSGRAHVKGKKGEIGLMQIKPIVLRDYYNSKGWSEKYYDIDIEMLKMYCPIQNLVVGRWYINIRVPQLLEAYGIEDTVENRLLGFTWGIGNLRKYLKGEIKMPKVKRLYLRKYKEGR